MTSVCARVERSRYSRVLRAWPGEVCAIIGGGPSVTTEAVASLAGRCRAIAINNSYQLAPWADVCYFADVRWWMWHRQERAFHDFAGAKISIQPQSLIAVPDPDVHVLRSDGRSAGLSEDAGVLVTGSNSGYAALNVATLAGATRILLLGFDMRYVRGRSHWHRGHPQIEPEAVYHRFARHFETMVPQLARLGVEVINCTPGSALKCFPRGDLADATKNLPELTAGDRAPIAAQT